MKVYLVLEHDIESTTVHCVTMNRDVADEIEKIDPMLSVMEFDDVVNVPERKTVYIVSGDPATGDRPAVKTIECWPWDYFLTRTVDPDVVDRRTQIGIMPRSLERRMVAHVFGVSERDVPEPPPYVVRCQDLGRAIATYDAEIARRVMG